jgi:para-aminobenzoate synthetase component 1
MAGNSRPEKGLAEDFRHRPGGQSSVESIEKERASIEVLESFGIHVSDKGVLGGLPQHSHPLLGSLATDEDHSSVQVDMGLVQSNQFRDTTTRGIEGFQDGPVSSSLRVALLGGGQQGFDLILLQVARNLSSPPGPPEQGGGIGKDSPLCLQPPEEGFQGGEMPRKRTGAQTVVGQSTQMQPEAGCLDVPGRRPGALLSEELKQPFQVGSIGPQGVRTQPSRLAQVGEEVVSGPLESPHGGAIIGRMEILSVRILAEGEGPTPVQMLQALPRATRPVLLDSSDGRGWTFLGWNPDSSCRGRVTPGIPSPGQGPAGRWPLSVGNPGAALDEACRGEIWEADDPTLPLGPAWAGWLSFESGHAWEPFPWNQGAASPLPDWDFNRYRGGVLFDPQGGFKLLWAESQNSEAEERKGWEEEFRRLLAAPPARFEQAGHLVPETSPKDFESGVETLRKWIGEGELFQANLSHRLVAPAPGNPRALYSGIRESQPTSMSAYWEDEQGRSLLSWSPELFLSVEGDRLETRPIKGTAPRSAEPLEDAAQASGLEMSPKEVAELTMIVDMARHDLGRLAPPGGVQVLNAGEVEAFPTLFHRTARIQGTWNPEDGLSALLGATFPPASISGAPKVRALQAIAELEGVARGPYCGALGWWRPGTPRGAFSVLIRTAEACPRRLSLRVGAGIVWDSEPAREWEETLLKARFLGPCIEAHTKIQHS